MPVYIWVDADSVPTNLRQIILRAASRTDATCRFVADRDLKDVRQFIADDTFMRRQKAKEEGMTDETEIKTIKSKISIIVVQSGENSADDYIVQNAENSQLCITHDIPLASRLLDKGCIVIDDRGRQYTDSDIRAKLSDRLVNQELRSWGVFSEQQKKIDASKQKDFADMLDRTLIHMMKEEQ